MTAPRNSCLRVLLLLANAAGALASVGLVGACGPRIAADAPRALHAKDALVARASSAFAAHTAAAAVVAEAHKVPAALQPTAPHAVATAHAARPSAWVGITASRGDRGAVAAWSATTVASSSDGGATFRTVFASRAHVDAVALDAEGALFVVRGARDLSVRAPGGKVTHHALAFAKTTASLTTGAGTLAWLGTRMEDGAEVPALALSKDDGATWTFATPKELGNAQSSIEIDDDGTLRLLKDTEAGCGGGYQARYIGSADGATWTEAAWPLDAPGSAAIGAAGFAYGIGDCGDGEPGHLCAVDPSGHATAVSPVQDATFKDLHAVTRGGVTWATIEGTLARLEGTTVTFPGATPSGFALTAIDADGEPMGTAHGKAMRFSPRNGTWQTLFAPHGTTTTPAA